MGAGLECGLRELPGQLRRLRGRGGGRLQPSTLTLLPPPPRQSHHQQVPRPPERSLLRLE